MCDIIRCVLLEQLNSALEVSSTLGGVASSLMSLLDTFYKLHNAVNEVLVHYKFFFSKIYYLIV